MKLFVMSMLLSLSAFAKIPTYSVDELLASENALTCKEFIVKIDEGMRLPLKIKTSGDAFEILGESELIFFAKRSCFLKMGQDVLLLSTDGEQWKVLEEYFTGMIGMSFELRDSGPCIAFEANVNKR